MDIWIVSIFQISSVAQSCLTLCDPMDCSTPGLSVHHQLPESTQTHLHWVGDAIQPSHPLLPLLLSPSIFPSIRIFSNESDLHIRWPQYWSFSFNISRLLWIMLLWTLVYKYLFESVFSSLGYLPRRGIRGIIWNISLVHSFSCVRSLVTPWTAAHQAFLSITNSQGLLKLMFHRVSDAIQPSHPLSSPSPPAFNLCQHQGLFKWVSSSHQVAKVLQLQLQHQSFQRIFRVDFP